MKYGIGLSLAAVLVLATPVYAAEAPASASASQNAGAAPSDTPPTVPPAAPGVFTAQKKGANGFHLVVKGHKFTSRRDIELYMAYRASEITQDQKGSWFTVTESRAKGDTAPVPHRDPAANRFSFRMEYFRPVWRYKTSGSPAWQTWSPFASAAFPDPKTVTDFEASADIVLRKGPMDDANPLAFEAGAVSDLLINQVSPPE